MKSIPVLWLLVILLWLVVAGAGAVGYVAWTDYVQPQWERFQKIEKRFEKLLERLPKPFREDGDGDTGIGEAERI